ncbi:DUF2515 family protein [Paenibacillus koleovorans]|uniref:DUF2515 family protein n=1 Tax=Paenibacillus koleovorans TaxID=121608 RepID=UPI000FDBC831|nr:DUF2515 family protein [Paenibacillus koleovorans]
MSARVHMRNSWVKRIMAIPGHALDYLKGKTAGLVLSSQLAEQADGIRLNPEHLNRLRNAYEAIAPSSSDAVSLTSEQRALMDRIQEETSRLNRNNVIRTKAYYAIYKRHPELHWAFLAHMVSRNGGWNMTDLRGELHPRLIGKRRAGELFAFLERSNALIFQDAYPQLLLYEASKARNTSLFHLLPHFHVSRFMKPIWELFWQERCSELLTIGLIVNEQSYIEGRVVQQKPYSSLLASSLLQLQSLLQLNVIVFPYAAADTTDASNPPNRLTGLILETFSDLDERIEIGKKLYAVLFGVPAIREEALRFAAAVPHSGSRSDYWPHLFAPIRKAPPVWTYTEKLQGCSLLRPDDPIYSPALSTVWPDRPVEPPDRYDWFLGSRGISIDDVMHHLSDVSLPRSFEITNEACFALNKLELAILAGEPLRD